MFDFLEEENIDPELLRELRAFREANPLTEELRRESQHPVSTITGKTSGSMPLPPCCVVRTYCLLAERLPAKMSWQKTWQWCLAALPGTFPFM